MTGSKRRQAGPGWRGTMRSLTVPGQGPNVPRLGRLVPLPDIPPEPVLSLAAFGRGRPARIQSMLESGPALSLTAGRIAIALALDCMGIGKGDKVLVPAFHATAMIEPLGWASAKPVFYRLRSDLSADLDDIAAKTDPSVRALMAVHYFGFHQPAEALRAFCDTKGLKLIENCAQAFFGTLGGRSIGSFGDYAVGSPRSFFPIADGGTLVSRDPALRSVELRSQSDAASAAALAELVGVAMSYGRLPWLLPFATRQRRARRALAPDGRAIRQTTEQAGDVQAEFTSHWTYTRMTGVSRVLMACASPARIVRRRRGNFLMLARGLSGLSGCRPLYHDLPDGVVPYLFPLWVDDLDRIFPLLEDAAIPMQRFGQFLWPGVDETVCPVSAAMSHHLVEFPCHQELQPEEIAAIVRRVRAAVG